MFATLALSVGGFTARAQLAGATLAGQVLDQSGSAVAAAKLVIKNNATGEVRTVTTNAKGLYSAQSLQPGIYSVAVSAPGFATRVQQTVELTVGATRELDLSLSPGQVSERVEVSADVADVETDTSVISATVGQKRIVDLPLNGRNFAQLLTLTPGVIPVSTSQNKSIGGVEGNVGIPGSGFSDPSFHGQQNRSKLIFLTGSSIPISGDRHIL